MYKLHELSRYVAVTDKGVKFPQDEFRKIRLEVLAEKETSLYIKDGKDEPAYIGTFRGFDIVEFHVKGPTLLQADGPGVKVFTTEFQSDVIEIPDAVSFTRVVERRERNPELEKMQAVMEQNMARRLRQLERDVTLRVSQEVRERHAELERVRFERASEEEARRVEESRAQAERDDEGSSEPGPGDDPNEPAGDVSGSRGPSARRKVGEKSSPSR